AEKLWPGENPIGKPIATNYLTTQWLTVVGVVAEASSWTMPGGAQNEIYVPMAQQAKALEQAGPIGLVARHRGGAGAPRRAAPRHAEFAGADSDDGGSHREHCNGSSLRNDRRFGFCVRRARSRGDRHLRRGVVHSRDADARDRNSDGAGCDVGARRRRAA